MFFVFSILFISDLRVDNYIYFIRQYLPLFFIPLLHKLFVYYYLIYLFFSKYRCQEYLTDYLRYSFFSESVVLI